MYETLSVKQSRKSVLFKEVNSFVKNYLEWKSSDYPPAQQRSWFLKIEGLTRVPRVDRYKPAHCYSMDVPLNKKEAELRREEKKKIQQRSLVGQNSHFLSVSSWILRNEY